MTFWFIILIVIMLLFAAGIVYLIRSFHRFSIIKKIAEKHTILSWAASIVPLVLIFCFGAINAFTPIIIIIHLMLFMIIARFCGRIFSKIRKSDRHPNIEGIAAFAITAVYLSIGWYNAHTVLRTEYSFTTDKNVGELKIAAIADSHLSMTLDGEKFAAEMERIQAEAPDLVLIGGDFVDDDSRKADMVSACEALGKLETKYGVYFIFGNHDKGYFESSRDFTSDDLRAELEKNNVKILEDESVLVDNKFYVIGRQDRMENDRADIKELTEGLDQSKYMIVIDHQPNDYKNESESAADMVFSGHTHGGHIWPAGYVGLITKANDRVYGTETRNNTNFVVSSGISGWGIPFKTGTVSEYVIINITENPPENN